ncbi:MAG: hypothetical protein K2M13_00015 [Muribaculaceae bacterium]|nr:hypothetical protein [Muribaculaceae bacterium]
MLENLKGGQAENGLFGGSCDPMGKQLCTNNCSNDCRHDAPGTVTGTVHGTELPEIPIHH